MNEPADAVIAEYAGTHVLTARGSPLLSQLPARGSVRDHIYIVDPLGNLMMRYPRDADPSKMKKDIIRAAQGVEDRVMYRNVVFLAFGLAFAVVVFGAYVRLNDAGLGCPDWPGCYGHATVPQPDTMRATAAAKFPGAGLEPRKAWIEMIHRYLAGTLGLLILALAILAWRRRMRPGATTGVRRTPWLQTILVVLVAFQAALGMWTVTLLLKPAIVTLHLVGGMLTLSVLAWLAMRELPWRPLPGYETAARLRPWTVLALVVVGCQIVLGGWVSTNYAALACTDFPTCHGTFAPPADYAHGFHVLRELGDVARGRAVVQPGAQCDPLDAPAGSGADTAPGWGRCPGGVRG